MQPLAPFRLAPYFQTRIWGFQDLAPWFDFKTEGEPVGEVWLTGAKCTVASGPLAGQNFAEVVKEWAPTILGAAAAPVEGAAEFPLLIKVLFPREKLSVQVHPDDQLAQQMGEPRGKTECWYALSAEPDTKVALGLEPGVTAEQVREAIEEQTLEKLLHWEPLRAGEMIYVDAGTVHAIWPGAVILETQQTSDTTFRLYDYGRPRELHVDQSLQAMRLHTEAGRTEPVEEDGRTVLVDKTYFRVERWKLDGAEAAERLAAACAQGCAGQDPALLFVSQGRVRLSAEGEEPLTLRRCELAVVPAHTGKLAIDAVDTAELIRIVPHRPER
jgi:mannose-6-phosphate isomerase